jgi:hypothetical protein
MASAGCQSSGQGLPACVRVGEGKVRITKRPAVATTLVNWVNHHARKPKRGMGKGVGVLVEVNSAGEVSSPFVVSKKAHVVDGEVECRFMMPGLVAGRGLDGFVWSKACVLCVAVGKKTQRLAGCFNRCIGA